MINIAILLGRVGKKDTKTTKNGIEMTMFSLATSKKVKNQAGESTEITTWHNINCFSKLSDVAKKYINVGDIIFVQGEIQNRKIEKGEREGQYIYSVHANDIRFIPQGRSEKKQNNNQSSDFCDDIPDF